MKSIQGSRARGRCSRIPTAIATLEESPSRLMTGPLPTSGGNQRYAAVSSPPAAR